MAADARAGAVVTATRSLLAGALLAGCVNAATINSSDAGTGAPAPVVCAGTRCAPGAACCLLTGQCFDPLTARSTCAIPADAGGLGSVGDPGQAACVSNADCRASEICTITMPFYQGCLGVGLCQPRYTGTCRLVDAQTLRPLSRCEFCGCDGVTYPTEGAAAAAGVLGHSGSCGVAPGRSADAGVGEARPSTIPCGLDAQCPDGAACCAITGFCYDRGCPGCCRIPPLGTAGACEHSSDCPAAAPMCEGGPACDSPGFCVSHHNKCGGELSPVCGCDGVTYSNECWAGSALVRVAHAGACP